MEQMTQVPTVQDIMRDQHVGKKRAWMIRRKLSAAAHDEPVPTNQREAVLAILRRDVTIRSSNDLTRALQAEGYRIDDHDATKTLWSLQKTGHVKFRERPHGLLYVIRLTPLGLEHRTNGALLAEATSSVSLDKDAKGHDITQSVGPEDLSDVVEVAQRAAAMQQAVNDLGAGPPDVIKRPWFKGNLGGWPAIRDVRDRARKTAKLTAAAKILEEIGEDDIALDLMTRTTFSPLEEEVITLLESFEELP